MGMRANDERGAAVDEMAEALLLGRGFRVEVEDDRVGLFAERAGGEIASPVLKGRPAPDA